MFLTNNFISAKIRMFLHDRRNRQDCWDIELYKKQLYAAYYGASLKSLHRIAVEHRIKKIWLKERSWALPLIKQRGCVNLSESLDIPYKITMKVPSSASTMKFYTYKFDGRYIKCNDIIVEDTHA